MTSTGIYRANQLLRDALEAQGFKTITFGEASETDLDKQNIFPYASITLLPITQSRSIEVISYSITILDIVDENNSDPRTSLNKFGLTNNIEDVFHDLAYKWNKAYQNFVRDTVNIVEVPDELSLEPGYRKSQNKLAGYVITLPITIPISGKC